MSEFSVGVLTNRLTDHNVKGTRTGDRSVLFYGTFLNRGDPKVSLPPEPSTHDQNRKEFYPSRRFFLGLKIPPPPTTCLVFTVDLENLDNGWNPVIVYSGPRYRVRTLGS